MRSIAVFGASGRTGRRVVDTAISRGFKINAFLRKDGGSHLEGEHITATQGSFEDTTCLGEVVSGTTAVVLALGPHKQNPQPVFADITGRIIRVMSEVGITRLVCITGALIGEHPANRTYFFERMRRSARKSMPSIMEDRDRQEGTIRTSPLDWTVVKPPRLTDKTGKGRYISGKDLKIGMMSSISREDLASFILGEIEKPRYRLKCVFVKG